MGVSRKFRIRWIAYFGAAYVASTLLYLYVLEKLLDVDLSVPFAQAFQNLKSTQSALLPLIGFSVLFHVAL